MIQLKGKYTTAEIMVDKVEEGVIRQVTFLCNHPLFENKPIKIMPDCHVGKGTVIGLACKFNENYAIPSLLGSDIGCCMYAVKVNTKKFNNDFKRLDQIVYDVLTKQIKIPSWLKDKISNVAKRIGTHDINYFSSFGSLGGGNHFISLERGKDTWLIIHTGSRNFGKDIYLYYMKKALIEGLYKGGEEKQLSWLDQSSQDYYESVLIAQDFAQENAKTIALNIVKQMSWKIEDTLYCPHNYIYWGAPTTLHKGSIGLGNLDLGVIPINMADGTFIIKGKDNNENWLYSAPHGAGRLMSREQAKETLNMKEYKERMKEVYSSNINSNTIDESPMAYKPIEEIKQAIEPICIIEDHLKPIYNYKN